MKSKTNNAVSQKISEVMKNGVRQNTHKPVSKSNKRHPVSQKQAVAIALNTVGTRRKKHARYGK